jgi:hypothetical protein
MAGRAVGVSFDYVYNEGRPNRQVRDGHLEQDCWCNPTVHQLCPECDGERVAGGAECWKCAGEGWVPEYDPERPSVIVHKGERWSAP